jgi:tetratricopeptide (TPR) repeat protein
MKHGPIFLDSLAASDVFGNLLETAFDEIAECGAAAFRRRRTPLRARQRAVLTRDERRRYGNELLTQGLPARAVTYLLSALQQDDGTAGLWLDVAKALRANGQHNDAMSALQSALQLDEAMLDGWTLFAEMAAQVGHDELAEQARGVIRQLRQAGASVEAVDTANPPMFF